MDRADITKLADEIERLLQHASPGEWFTFGHPWRDWSVPGCIFAGSPDPHAGTMVLDGPATWDLEENQDEAEVIAQADIDLELVALLKNAAPDIVRVLREAAKGPLSGPFQADDIAT